MANEYKVSTETQSKINEFDTANAVFKSAWMTFETQHRKELDRLEELREDRNAKLDEARRAIRAEVDALVDTRLTFKVGPFEVQKKWSDFYIIDKFVAFLKEKNLYDTAFAAGIVRQITEIADYKTIKAFVTKHSVDKEFECCEDGKDAGSAISGPKPVPAFGAEAKSS